MKDSFHNLRDRQAAHAIEDEGIRRRAIRDFYVAQGHSTREAGLMADEVIRRRS